MSPAAIAEAHREDAYIANTKAMNNGSSSYMNGGAVQLGMKRTTFLFDRHLHKDFPVIVRGSGSNLYTKDGRVIFDATSGAAVSCLGHGNKRVTNAVFQQMASGIPYLASGFFGHETVDDLCEELINGTGRKMARVYLTGSGSEAMEATCKLARQYFYEKDKSTPRVNFITREGSYHGNTLGALGMSGHKARRAPYAPFLMPNVHHVSSCNPYRQRLPNESDASFVSRKAAELEAKFQELGPETVIGFCAEPIVGAALGCVAALPGYLKAMRNVCHRHGALFILDEVMCGMGRTGTLHAWQSENVVPDLQTIGKGLGGGYQPVAGVLISQKVVNVLYNGTGQFIHGQTYQGMPVQAAAALEVQRIIRQHDVLDNVRTQGAYLGKLLKQRLSDHPNVGDIRGKGLFWGIEFVKDKKSKVAFEPKLSIAQKIHDLAISHPYNMTMYPGTGTVDGMCGDHIMLSPNYLVTKEDIEYIVRVTVDVIETVFENL
ncbi:hypothetical protein EAE96_008155 [Botrytis aclada]|nr:hypothetical protein EAE96_008155 [Botrytis aclada]